MMYVVILPQIYQSSYRLRTGTLDFAPIGKCRQWIRKCVLLRNEFYIESLYPQVLRKLLSNKDIRVARVQAETPEEFIQNQVSAEDQANLQYQKLLNEDYDVSHSKIDGGTSETSVY